MDWPASLQKALDEHRKLNREVEILKLRLDAPVQNSPSKWMAHCVDHFRKFQTLLIDHQTMEETEGFMTVVRERRPTLSGRVDALKAEHGVIRKQCDELREEMEKHAEPSSDEVARVRALAGKLLEVLYLHEREENRLVQEALTRDLGAGD